MKQFADVQQNALLRVHPYFTLMRNSATRKINFVNVGIGFLLKDVVLHLNVKYM